jgi:predicted GNAT superfamily acetyltransferase
MAIIRILETPEEMEQAEHIQAVVWPGSDMDVVPGHMLLTAAHNGGLVLGAFEGEKMVGMLFGFVGLYDVPDGPRPKHCSHQMGVLPDARDAGIGFALKRAQWQMVRRQGLDRITWTYDPLMSRNGRLNIGRLGAVCNTFLRSLYGDMRDGLNAGLPSDRFQVDLWVNTHRVERRMSDQPLPALTLEECEAADVQVLYPVDGSAVFVRPPGRFDAPGSALILAEIPSDFLQLKETDFKLARDWRFFSREIFETCFSSGYLVTDFVFDSAHGHPRSFYLLTHGEATL